MPGGPDSWSKSRPGAPVKYGFEPIIRTGRFQVLRADPMELYYRLVDAVAITQ